MSKIHGDITDQQDFLDETLGRGAGDPDSHTPPWEQEPSKEDLNNAHYVIGNNKPKVVRTTEPEDPHSYAKWSGAKKYGISINDMADEPDEMSDHSDDQEYDK